MDGITACASGAFSIQSEPRGVILAGVHLVALRMNLEKKFFIGGWLELLRDLLHRSREQKNRASGEQRAAANPNAIAHGVFPPVRAEQGFEAQCN